MNSAAIDPRAVAAQRRGRIHALRMRVATGAVMAFLALWGVLFVQLATGHDPGLNDAATTAVVQSADPDATSSSSSGWEDADASDDGSGGSDGTSPSTDASSSGAVTTSQS